MNSSRPFWQTKTLEQMSPQEWESLCDGCALCCLHKLEDEDSGDVYYTRVACRYLDAESCRCNVYPRRQALVPDCVQVTPQLAREAEWLPLSCAYRRLAEGQDLAWWHPLVSGDPRTVAQAGFSVKGKYVSEDDIGEGSLVDYLIEAEDLLASVHE